MFEIRNETANNRIKTGIIFLIIGAIVCAVFFYFYYKIERENKSYDKQVEAFKIEPNCTIDHDGDESCSPIYHFKVYENKYVCKSTHSSSKYDEEEKTVYYKKGNPSFCVTQFDYKNSFIFLIGSIGGMVLVFLSICCFIGAFFASRKVTKLLKYGTLFKGVPFIPEVTNDNKITIPVVDLIIPNGSTLHLIGDPISSRQFGNTGETVDVLIDLNHPKRYYIDFEIRMSGNFNNNVIDYREKKADIFGENEPQENVSDRINNLIGKN